MARLASSRVAVFGVGGVGGYVCEALARSGVGALDLIDDDEVSVTNINRQIIALHSTVGRKKVDVMRERILDINPAARVTVYPLFYTPETAARVPLTGCSYMVDAVDTVTAKLTLVEAARELSIPIICSMGAGNKLDPTRFRVSDIYKTSVDPLARVMRLELRKRGVRHLKVVWSDEPPLTPVGDVSDSSRRSTPGSAAFAAPAAGLVLASEVIRDLIRPDAGNA